MTVCCVRLYAFTNCHAIRLSPSCVVHCSVRLTAVDSSATTEPISICDRTSQKLCPCSWRLLQTCDKWQSVAGSGQNKEVLKLTAANAGQAKTAILNGLRSGEITLPFSADLEQMLNTNKDGSSSLYQFVCQLFCDWPKSAAID